MGLKYKLNLNDKMIRKINVRNYLLKKESLSVIYHAI